MGLESGVASISDLNSAWPTGTEGKDEGDDHLRNIKVALRSLLGATGLMQLGFPDRSTGTDQYLRGTGTGYEFRTATQVAGDIGLPASPTAGTWLRRNSANDAWEEKTDAEVASLIGGEGLFSTGDLKLTLKSTADAGWVMMDDGTIGDASSLASTRAHADTEALFTLLWGFDNSLAPVSGGKGLSASADFAAHKTIGLTKVLGRALCIAGSGSGLTARTLGSTTGAETAVADLAAHTHTSGTLATSSNGAHSHTVTVNGDVGGGAGIKQDAVAADPSTALSGIVSTAGDHTHTVSGSTASAGSGGGHANMQPSAFLNVMLKL